MTSDSKDGTKSSSGERRGSGRIDTSRDVVFSDYQATGPLRAGIAENMSAGGFRIRTTYPEPIGAEIQIELQPEPDSNTGVVLFRGRVVHVTRGEDGEHYMGIRINRRRTAPAPLPETDRKDDSVDHEKSGPRWRFVGSHEAKQAHAPQEVRFQKVQPPAQRRRRRSIWGSLFGLFLLTLFLGSEALQATETGEDSEASGALLSASLDPKTLLDPNAFTSQGQAAGAPRHEFEQLPNATISGLSSPRAIHAALNTSGDTPDLSPLKPTTIGKLERSGVSNTPRLQSVAPRSPSPLKTPNNRLGLLLDAEPEWSAMTAVVAAPATAQANVTTPFRIEVRRSDYILRVLRGDTLVRSFPVGLGRDSATPDGSFAIANKISDPEWYNAGDPIPAGDARNPLGNSWMGLDGTAADRGIGIHPTADDASIGQSTSQGCIRMRPRDAEALFRLVPIGTPVHILS